MDLSFKTALQKSGWQGKLLAHVMAWFGEPNHTHRITRYRSVDPWVIRAQLDNMQAVGIDGVIVTWQGTDVSPYVHQATYEMCFQCEQRKMLFALLLDPWIVKGRKDQTVTPEQEVLNQLNKPTVQWMLGSSAYLPEKYVLDFIGTSALDWSKVTGPFEILHRHTDYSWPEIKNTLTVLTQNDQSPTMRIPGIGIGFNDGGFVLPDGTRDYAHSVWDKTIPTRVIDHEAGNTFLDQTIVSNAQHPSYAAIVTWNDHDEGTSIEQFVSALTGIRIFSQM